jgi:hypothetical protein
MSTNEINCREFRVRKAFLPIMEQVTRIMRIGFQRAPEMRREPLVKQELN